MSCYKCGSEHGSVSRLCPDCNQARIEGREKRDPVYQEEVSRINRSSQLQKYCTILALALLGTSYVLFSLIPEAVLYGYKDGHFIVSAKDGKAQLRFSFEESTSIQGHILHFDKTDGSLQKNSGVFLQLHYLSPHDYKSFVANYGESGHCPASFYNAHIKHLFLLTDLTECRNKLSAPNYDKWDSFSVKGSYLKFEDGFNEKGRVMVPTGNFRFFVVESC